MPLDPTKQFSLPDEVPVVDKQGMLTTSWQRWFTYLAGLLQKDPIYRAEQYNEFWDIDFWANADDAGAPGATSGFGTTDHPGIVRLSTGAVMNNTAATWSAGPSGLIRMDQCDISHFVFQTPPTITTCRFEAGLTSNPQSGWSPSVFETGNDMFYLHFDTAVDTALRAKCRAGGVTTASVTVVDPCPASTDIQFDIQRRAVGASFVVDMFVNSRRITTVTGSSLPANSARFGGTFKVSNRVAADRTLDVDLGYWRSVALAKRWSVSL